MQEQVFRRRLRCQKKLFFQILRKPAEIEPSDHTRDQRTSSMFDFDLQDICKSPGGSPSFFGFVRHFFEQAHNRATLTLIAEQNNTPCLFSVELSRLRHFLPLL